MFFSEQKPRTRNTTTGRLNFSKMMNIRLYYNIQHHMNPSLDTHRKDKDRHAAPQQCEVISHPAKHKSCHHSHDHPEETPNTHHRNLHSFGQNLFLFHWW